MDRTAEETNNNVIYVNAVCAVYVAKCSLNCGLMYAVKAISEWERLHFADLMPLNVVASHEMETQICDHPVLKLIGDNDDSDTDNHFNTQRIIARWRFRWSNHEHEIYTVSSMLVYFNAMRCIPCGFAIVSQLFGWYSQRINSFILVLLGVLGFVEEKKCWLIRYQ